MMQSASKQILFTEKSWQYATVSMSDNDDLTPEGDLGLCLGLGLRHRYRQTFSSSESIGDFSVPKNLSITTDDLQNRVWKASNITGLCCSEVCRNTVLKGSCNLYMIKNDNLQQSSKFSKTGNTSLRQELQRMNEKCFSISKLKETEFNKHTPLSDINGANQCLGSSCFLQIQLKQAYEQISSLTSELEISRQLLHEKTRASKILLEKLNSLTKKHQSNEKRKRSSDSELHYQVNKLQYELQCSEDHLNDAQQVWLERFNSVSKSNEELTKTIKNQEHQIRTIITEKNAIKCERDELLGLIDYKERRFYQRSSSLPLVPNNGENVPIELAVLGACICRGPKQEPCGCARSASLKQRRLMDVQKQLETKSKLVEEMANLIDAQRESLEEEQHRNRELTKRLLNLEAAYDSSNISKPLIFKTSKVVHNPMNEELFNMLIDMLCDKTEAIQHQRFVIKVLARRLLELEELAKQENDS